MTVQLEKQEIPSIQELKRQLEAINAAIDARRVEELKVLVDGFAKKLESNGFAVADGITELKAYLPKAKSKARKKQGESGEYVLYSNPADPKITWGGQGRRPSWVVAHLETGATLESLRV